MTAPVVEKKILQTNVKQNDVFTADIRARDWSTTIATTSKKPLAAPLPTELLLSALGGCMISGINREAQARNVPVDDIEVDVKATRVGGPSPVLEDLHVHITAYTNAPAEQVRPILEALSSNGTVTNTLQRGVGVTITYDIVPV